MPVGGTLNMPTGASYVGSLTLTRVVAGSLGFQFSLMMSAIHLQRTGGAGGFPCPVSLLSLIHI